jgi:uncharacterized protein (DUF1015 family)
MATVRPFRAVRYPWPELSAVVSQPYDRIGPDLQQLYYDLSPHNVVRIVQGQALPGDRPDRPDGPSVYTRARETFDLWRAAGVLARDPEPALYVYHQTFSVDGIVRTRRAFVAAFPLAPFEEGVVLPHEQTLAAPKEDRIRLMRAMAVNPELVFVLYPDPANRVVSLLDSAIAGRSPNAVATELFESDVRQQLWVVTDGAVIRAVQEEMAPKAGLIIADGHHRYETALRYRSETLAAHPGSPASAAFNHAMVSLVSTDDPGLVILPTHREVFGCPVTPAEVLAGVATWFQVNPAVDLRACLAQMKAYEGSHAIGFYADHRFWVLVLRHLDRINGLISVDRSLAWKSLDVAILHEMVLQPIVGLSQQAQEAQTNLRYHRDPTIAVARVDSGQGDYAFLLNPTRVAQVRACAERGERMPQKSTDFYPKMITGLTMLPVDPEPL